MVAPEWLFWALLPFGVGFAAFALMRLMGGEVVGSIEGPWFKQMGGKGMDDARLIVLRHGAAKSGNPTVQLQVRVIGMMQGCTYTPHEARKLADLLDEAAQKTGPR
jgi:hypothetical protein